MDDLEFDEATLLAYAEQTRSSYRAESASAGPPDPVGSVVNLQIPCDGPPRSIPARLYRPGSRGTALDGDGSPVVLFVHGGGFVSGDLNTHDVLARALANRSRAAVLSLDYRLAPEAPFPAALDDTLAALQWISDRGSDLALNPKRTAIAGDSAGGNLAAAACIASRERGVQRVTCQVLFYPVLAGTAASPSRARLGASRFPTQTVLRVVHRAYVGKTSNDPSNPLVAPLNAELRDLPPALVVTAEFDPLKDEGRAYAEKLRLAGVPSTIVEYAGVGHGFVQFFKDPVNEPMGVQALDQAAEFLARHLSTSS